MKMEWLKQHFPMNKILLTQDLKELLCYRNILKIHFFTMDANSIFASGYLSIMNWTIISLSIYIFPWIYFREGYLRLACEPFELNATSLKNRYIHLTNNAVQKNHDKYGKFELGN